MTDQYYYSESAYLDHGGSPRYWLFAREVKVVELKKVTALEQELADPKLDGWLVTYLENHGEPHFRRRPRTC